MGYERAFRVGLVADFNPIPVDATNGIVAVIPVVVKTRNQIAPARVHLCAYVPIAILSWDPGPVVRAAVPGAIEIPICRQV